MNSSLQKYRRKINEALAELSHVQRTVDDCRTELKRLKVHRQAVLDAQSLLQAAAESVQQIAHKNIASVVQRCLETVFGDKAHGFRIRFERKRGRTEANLVFVGPDDHEMSAREIEGGQVDVAALALRLAALVLSVPKQRLFLALDEPLKNVNGEEYQDRAGPLLLKLAKEMGIQFLIVSDDNWLKIGKVVDL